MKTFNSYRPEPAPKDDKDKRKGNQVAKDSPKGHKKYFKCNGYGHF